MFCMDMMLCVSVPYSDGWSAYVDGEKVPIYRVNDLFIGLETSQGMHNIELKYVTPGLKLGIGVSILSILVIILLMIKYRISTSKSIQKN